MQKYTAIILLSLDTNEFDRIYIMYTLEKGLVSAVAKGARKPAARLAGHLEPATFSEVYIARSRGMGQITSSITVSNYKNIKKSFEKLEAVLSILKFFAKNFREEEKDERIFELLSGFLRIADTVDNASEAAFTDRACLDLHQAKRADTAENVDLIEEAFWWKLFDLLGQKPEALKCVKCSQKLVAGQNNFFSIKKGGILCGSCKKAGSDEFSINENQIKLLRIFFGNSLKSAQKVKINPADIKSLEKIRKNYQKYYFG